MALGLGVLRLAPQDFWGMTLPEMSAALAGLTGEAWSQIPMSRYQFTELMVRYPDNSKLQEA